MVAQHRVFAWLVTVLAACCAVAGCAAESRTAVSSATWAPGETPIPTASPRLDTYRFARAVMPDPRDIRENLAEAGGAVSPVGGAHACAGGATSCRLTGDARCRRWYYDLRDAARHLAALDPSGRTSKIDYVSAEGAGVGVTLLVAAPPMLDGLSTDPLAGCRSFTVPAGPSGASVTVRAEPVPRTAGLGQAVRAYAHRVDGARLLPPRAVWTKEVRFGPYLLQVRMSPASPERAFRDRAATGADLDRITERAYRRARAVLTDPSATMPPPANPTGPPQAVDESEAGGERLRAALLPGFRRLRPAGQVEVTRYAPALGRAGSPWVRRYAAEAPPGVCRGLAGGLWRAAAESEVAKQRRQIATVALEDRKGLFATETIVWGTPLDDLERLPRTGACTTFEGGYDKAADGRVEPIGTRPIGSGAHAFRLTTSQGGSPTYVKWFRLGAFYVEVRAGTVGAASSAQVTPATLDELAEAAARRANAYQP